MDDNTEEQIAFENAVKKVREGVKAMKEAGADFSQKALRTAYRKKMVDTMKRVMKDKRIFK